MKAAFITDFGQSLTAKDAETGEVKMTIARFGVWGEMGRGKPEVIETSDDLDYLQAKHGPGLEVHRLGRGSK